MKINNYVTTENQGFSVSFKLPAGTSKIQKFNESASVKVCCIFILVMYIIHFHFFQKELYQFVAQVVVPPFTLFTHTRVPLPLVQDVIDYPTDL